MLLQWFADLMLLLYSRKMYEFTPRCMQMKRMQQEMSASLEANQQAKKVQEVLTLEAHRAQGTARQVLNQLAEDRDAAGFKASRLCGIIEELRAEKRDLISKVRRPIVS